VRGLRGRGCRVSDEPPRYTSSTDLSSRVGGLNGQWNDDWSPQLQDERFSKAMALAGAEFLDCVNYFGKVRGDEPSPPPSTVARTFVGAWLGSTRVDSTACSPNLCPFTMLSPWPSPPASCIAATLAHHAVVVVASRPADVTDTRVARRAAAGVAARAQVRGASD
jgi:hypothetical protein